MNIFTLLNSLHKALGRSTFAVRLAISLRNQCNCVIRYCFNEGPDPAKNGERWLTRTIAPKSSTFIDVGANVGDWANLFMEAMPKNGRGILLEPSDQAISKLKQRYDGMAGIKIIKAAVSDSSGVMYFYEETAAGETSSLVAGFSRESAVKKVVNVTTLDAEAEKHQLEYIDFLKVDAEGYDLHVLRGASGLLAQKKIGVLQFEYNRPWKMVGSSLTEAFQLLESFGYQVFLLKNTGMFDIKFEGQGEYFDYSNYVAVSLDKIADLKPFIDALKIFESKF